ncbi:MAG: hypothetical protein KKG75_00890 [Nanoarchaeota archaeon]|nr:hypothetical protein [Nanoarchaeota archaeon]
MTEVSDILRLSKEEIDKQLTEAYKNQDEEFQEKWGRLTIELGCDHGHCNSIGVRDYPNLPKRDMKRVRLSALYLVRK